MIETFCDWHAHPILVHFPIALFISALGLELVSLIFKKENLHSTAIHIYILATLLAPLAVQTGLWEAEEHHLANHPVLILHRQFALLTMWTSLASLPIFWFLHKKQSRQFRIVFLIFILVIVSFVSIAAYNGGRMVFDYGVGVGEK